MMNHAQTNPAPNQPQRQRGRWFYRLVRLFFSDAYKRGYAAGRAVVNRGSEDAIRDMRQHVRVTDDCYRANLTELSREIERREEAERKLKECRRYLRAANKGAERNAIVAKLLVARKVLHRRTMENHELKRGLPNNVISPHCTQ